MISLKTLLRSDRPREKIEKMGVDSLTTTELLMVILGSGSRKIPVHRLARKIEQQFEQCTDVSLTDLLNIKGIGLAKACQILASLELVERLRPRFPDEVLNSVQKILPHVFDLKVSPREMVVCLYLNARLRLVHKEILSIGSVNQAIITPKEVFSAIKQLPVTHIVLAHNHPSGDTSPSADDLQFTKHMSEAATLLGIVLLDHIIVSREGYYSLKQNQQL